MGTHRAQPDGVLSGENAHALGAHGQGLVVGEPVGDGAHALFQVVHGGHQVPALVVGEVPAGAADDVHAVVDPVACEGLQHVHGALPVVPALHEQGVVAHNVAGDAQPQKVGVNALQLLDDDPDVLAPLGHFHAGDVLNAQRVGQGVGVGTDAAYPLHQHQGLDKVALLGQPLNAPVVVAHKDLGVGDALAVHGETGVNGLLQSGMVGADGNGITHNDLPDLAAGLPQNDGCKMQKRPARLRKFPETAHRNFNQMSLTYGKSCGALCEFRQNVQAHHIRS